MQMNEILFHYAMHYIGTWYTWGGSNADSFDCSGFACELLQGFGKISRGERLSASGIWERFASLETQEPDFGCFVFYFSSDDPERIIHIEFCLSPELSIGASGGGSKTLTKEDAIRDNAFVKIRPFRSRSNIKGFLQIF